MIYNNYPDGAIGLLFVVLAVLLFERQKIAFLLFLLLAFTIADYDGVQAGIVYWVAVGLVRLAMEFFSMRGDSTLMDLNYD